MGYLLKAELENANILQYGEVIVIRFVKKVKVTEEDALNISLKIIELANRNKHTLLFDAKKVLFLSQEAREIFSKQQSPKFFAVAILVETAFQRAFANLHMKARKSTTPYKIFTKEQKAIEWLKEYLN